MKYVSIDASNVVPFGDIFDTEVFQHGRYKVGFGINKNSVDNPVSVCVGYRTGERLLEVADWSDGGSAGAGMGGGDRDLVVSTQPFAKEGDGGVLAVLRYRQGSQPALYIDGEQVDGGASRFSSFVSRTGAANEDPKPRRVQGNEVQEEYLVNRKTGQAAWTDYFVHIHRLSPTANASLPALTLEVSGLNPATDTVFPEPACIVICPNCGYKL